MSTHPDNKKTKFKKPRKGKWIIIAITIVLGLVALWAINMLANQIRKSEQAKVRLWASAIGQKAELMSSTETFFNEVGIDERRKVKLYIDVLQSFNKRDLGSDAEFYLSYVSYIVDSSRTPFMILDSDSVITSCGNIFETPQQDGSLIGTKATPELLELFGSNPPFHYNIWGIPLTLLYRESQIYSDMRSALENLNRSFLSEVTNNSVFVPVIVVDSNRQQILGSGNINGMDFNTEEKLQHKLQEMANENEPITLRLANHQLAYVYYESTPLLKMLRILPIVYLFLAFILVLISYNLFRTARSEEENRVWVGMAKETAHQLGTPISSLSGWADYLEGKTLEEPYLSEIRKDIDRLDTIARRFSKIGSVPELNEEDICEVIRHTINYMEKRSPKKIKFITTLPDKPVMVPLNRYLFEWVVENICKNAIDAMEGRGTFSTIVITEGNQIHIDLCDTGKGIPASQQKLIFESGFSTKQRGWGLGLSLAKRIIEEYHKGKIYLKYSVPGQGTVFHITLSKA
ncbi:MAG: HAMP domain-containing histidine kinase [Bacteroidales bacterium]|nr:HAMP domain-containing histidine kinase [Bacteroidales bacterium]